MKYLFDKSWQLDYTLDEIKRQDQNGGVKMKRLNELKELARLARCFEPGLYWLNAMKRIYNLTNAELGYIITQL